jgi:HlyD family secretion protein
MKSKAPSASPQFKRRSIWQKKGFWALLLLVLVAAGGAGWYFLMGPGSAAKTTAATTSETYTTPVKRGDLSISASGSGKLVAYQAVDLSFSTNGTVKDVNVKLGDTVKAGQLLATLADSDTLQANLTAAELQVLQAQKALTDLQQNNSVDLAQAYSDLLAAKDTYDTALTTSQKVTTTRCSKEVTTRYSAVLDRATTALNNVHAEKPNSDAYIAAKKSYDTALANYNYCAAHTSDEKASAQTALDVAKAAVQDALTKYDTLKTASGVDQDALALDELKLQQAQAQLANAKEELTGMTLNSPIDGKVTYLGAEAGQMVDTSKFITISDVNHPTLDISLDESDLDKLIVGSSVTVSFDALSDQSFTGKVTQVDPQITTSGQYRIAKGQVQLDTSAAKAVSVLPLGISATVNVVNQEVKNALLVPVIALKDLGDNSYAVMVKGSDDQLKLQPVTIGIQDSDYVVITSGLKDGQEVSTGSVHFIAAGSSTDANAIKNAQNAGNFRFGPPGQ